VRIERMPGMETPPPKARLEVESKKGIVRLVEPTEPLAWAVGTQSPDGVFRCAWHSERLPGTKPRPAEREADVSALGKRVPLRVHVWGDDGSVAEASP
jgi:hypothetical protein